MKPTARDIPQSIRREFAPYFESPVSSAGFHNPWDHPALPTLSAVLRWKTQRNRVRAPGYRVQSLSVVPNALPEFNEQRGRGPKTRLFWIGHASFLLELDDVRFVIDPIFGRAGGLVPRVTPAAAMPAQLSSVAAILVTHGHHDHLDPSGLRQLAAANEGKALFIVPRGLKTALPRECEPVVELDWWEQVSVGGVRVHLVPAQHWHRRGAFDLNKSLWGGYVLEGSHRVYHSGDTGYFGGFRAIGTVFDGIDAACLPLGAYEPRWFMGSQHMSPEQSLQAMQDLSATHFVGMHWGAYDLSDEAIDAGPELARAAAVERGITESHLHIVRPGGSVALHGEPGHTQAETRHSLSAQPR